MTLIVGDTAHTGELFGGFLIMLAPCVLNVRRPFDLIFQLGMNLALWGNVFGLFDQIYGDDKLVHYILPCGSSMLYIALCHLRIVSDLSEDAGLHGRVAMVLVTLAVGLDRSRARCHSSRHRRHGPTPVAIDLPNLRSIADIRADFPGLSDGWAALDGAAGTLVPGAVINAIANGLREAMANVDGRFAASARSMTVVSEARRAVADLVGGASEGVVLGPNMTTLTFHMAGTLAADWGPGDEVVVTSLDHDANVRPWLLAAERAGATARWAEFDVPSGELSAEAFDEVINERTRLVAVTAASNAIGTRPDVRAIADRAHGVGALVYVDGVHATPHFPTDVSDLGADLYACSTYKLCGPHAGSVIAAPELLERLVAAKLAPAPDTVPERFERGTPAFEQLAGITAAIDWLAAHTDAPGSRRERLLGAFGAIERRLARLLARTVDGLGSIEGVRVLGAPRQRTSTVSFLVEGHTPQTVATALAQRRVAVWDGDNYAYELMRRFGLDRSGGAVRASVVLYNDEHDVDRLLEAVAALAGR